MLQKIATALFTVTIIPYLMTIVLKQLNTEAIRKGLGKALMSLPRIPMMVLMALPQQAVMASFEPSMPLWKRLSVSIAMYLAHFAYNGFVMKPERSYNELVWILATALYALYGLNVKLSTFVALIAADSVMTLGLRGLA